MHTEIRQGPHLTSSCQWVGEPNYTEIDSDVDCTQIDAVGEIDPEFPETWNAHVFKGVTNTQQHHIINNQRVIVSRDVKSVVIRNKHLCSEV